MLLFKKNIKHKSSTTNEVPVDIINKWKTLKRRLAVYLQQKSELLSMPVKKYSLAFFFILFGGSSIAIIIHSTTTKQDIISVAKISKSPHLGKQKFPALRSDSLITKKEYERIIDFKNYLFRLRDDPAERNKFDSIITNRPLLIDSITLFEKMYLSQK
jgi:hypothetical protein